jgi:hypothetical protein
MIKIKGSVVLFSFRVFDKLIKLADEAFND